MDVVTWWMKLSDKLTDMQVRASDMARGACNDGKFYWLGRYDAIREVAMELQPIALQEEAPTQPTTRQSTKRKKVAKAK